MACMVRLFEDESASQQQARKIMGENFLGIAEAIRFFGVSPTNRQLADLAKVPFPEELLWFVKDTHILAAVFPVSVREMMRWHEPLFSASTAKRKGDGFAYEKGALGWQLVRKTPVPDSFGKAWEQQLLLLGKGEEVPSAQTVIFMVIGHFRHTGERLFPNLCVRTSSSVRTLGLDEMPSYAGRRICVGPFGSDGLVVCPLFAAEHHSDIGLASAHRLTEGQSSPAVVAG